MNINTRNIFNALFEFRPRGKFTPEENFLTEAFAYVLESCEDVQKEWLSRVIGNKVRKVSELRTRFTERDDDDNFVIPDMKISGELDDGHKFVLFSEHKWRSPCNPGQIKRYIKKLESDTAEFKKVIFIGTSYSQVNVAENCHPSMKGGAFLWADVFSLLGKSEHKETVLLEFLEFMKAQDLSPGEPITTEMMTGYLQSRKFESNLQQLASALSREFNWSFVPERYRNGNEYPEIIDAMGRVSLQFGTSHWKPALGVGFLYNTTDLRVAFVDPKRGIDLFLRIETDPDYQKRIQNVMRELKTKKDELTKHADSVLLHKDPGNGNKHSILLVRSCLSNVIQDKQERHAQLEVIHATIRKWIEILFKDGELERALKDSGLNGGQKERQKKRRRLVAS